MRAVEAREARSMAPKSRTSVLMPRVTPVAWEPNGALDLETWARLGTRLATHSRAAGWWIGDWICYGNARFGEKYARAVKLTLYDKQTLMNMAYVAGRFAISRRREALSWSHHAELAALAVEEQEHWLDVAEQDRLSVRCLRHELRERRCSRKITGGATRPADNQRRATESETTDAGQVALMSQLGISCPNCGHYVDLGSSSQGVHGQ